MDEVEARTDRLRRALLHRLIAAPATPLGADGRLWPEDLECYARSLAGRVDGVCVWAHTGRGLDLPDDQRDLVLTTFRAAVAGPVLAGVGPRHAGSGTGRGEGFAAELAATLRMAERAAELGADGLMVYPVPALREPSGRTDRVLRLHDAVAAATGLPVIGFLLYPEAGGAEYDSALLAELAARPAVVGVKLATLYQAVRCQEAIAAIRDAGGLAITGEDRMFGPSLMWGAQAALVGIAAAAAGLSTRLVRTWFAGEGQSFLAASARLDRLAVRLFAPPFDGYVQRMLWVAQREGMIPDRSAFDPHGTALDPAERRAVWAAYDEAAYDEAAGGDTE
jgi:4-hydroxy-tetrahydrodipicolinate synthase